MDLAPHAIVRSAIGERRFDQFVGLGFVLLLAPDVESSVLPPSQKAFLDALGASVVSLSATATVPGQIVDVQGKFTDYMDTHYLKAIIVRPDFYVFGGASTPSDIASLIDCLATQLADYGFTGQKQKAAE
jgi:hypothetical protein